MKSLTDKSRSLRHERLSLLKEKERRLGLKDLFYFGKHIIGNVDFDEGLHGELCDFTTRPGGLRKKLILLPRGTFKSSAITIGQSLWEAVKNPDIRILIDSEKMQNSSKFLGAIKGIVQSNDRFRSLYGDLAGDKANLPWSAYEATLSTRTRRDLKEPTFSTAGVDVVKVGMHYDLVIMDDPVSENNTTTKEQIQKVIDHYKYLLSILEPTGRLIIIGTRWDYGDLYGYIMEDEADTFDVMIRKALWENEETGEAEYLFPARLTPAFLKEIKKSQGSYIFACQYLNEPADKENAVFRKSWLKYYDGEVQNRCLLANGRVLPLNIFILIDPAISKAETADYSAIVTVGVDEQNNLYVLEAVNERLSPYELDDAIFAAYEKWKPLSVAIEHHANQSYFAFTLPAEQKKRGIFFRIEELKPYGDKESRIRRLQPMFEAGAVFLPRGKAQVMEDQLLRFPFSRHDDLIDALGYAPDVCYPKQQKKERTAVYRPLSLVTGY